MHYTGVQQAGLMKNTDRVGENGINATVPLPMPERPVDPAVVDFGMPILACPDRQLLPLTAKIQQLQDVIKDGMQRQLRGRSSASLHKMQQDKLLKLCKVQIRRNPLPLLASLLFHP